MFEEKTEKGKKVASNCKAVRDYEDLKIALEYLFKEDNVIIEVKVAESGYRGKIHYSTQNKHISLLKQAVFQILKNKTIDVRLNFISEYFRDKLADKPSEEQLKYFNFIKTLFENNFKNDKTIILSSFFSQHFEFLINHTELSYFLWLEGYTQEKDLRYIARQIGKEPFSTYQNSFKKIFEKLIEPNEQGKVLKELIEVIGSIDSPEKYNKIKAIADLWEIEGEIRKEFLISSYRKCDDESKYLLWIDNIIIEKSLPYIAKKISVEPILSCQKLIKKIFEKLKEPNEQDTVLKEFLETIGSIDNEEKYNRIKSLADLSELDEKVKEAFLIGVYGQSDIEKQYLMWLEGYAQEKDLSFIAKQIEKEPISSYQNPLKKIFSKLTGTKDQATVLKDFLELICSIDNEEKYRKIKSLSGLSELDEKVKEAFLIAVYRQSDIERQYLMWLEGYAQEKDLSFIAKQIEKEPISSYQNSLKKIFSKLTGTKDQDTVLKDFLELIGSIDNEEKYRKIKSLSGLSELDEKVKEAFLISVYVQSDIERQYLMWLEGYTQEKDLRYIAKQITKETIDSYYNSFEDIFEKLKNPHEQDTVLKEFLEIIGIIDNEEKYSRIKFLAELSELEGKVKEVFLISVYGQSDIERQYLMWLEGYTQEKNLGFIARQIEKEPSASYQNHFKKIFEKLTGPDDQDTVLKEFLEIIGSIDNEEKYNRIKSLADLSELDEKVKEAFLISVYGQSDIERQYQMWLEGYNLVKDLNYIAKQIEKEPIGSYQNPFKKIFEKLKEPNEQDTVLKEFLETIGSIDNEEKYRRIKTLYCLLELDVKVRQRFQDKVYIESDIHYKIKQFLDYLQFKEGDKQQQIINLFNNLDITSFYSFCLDLLNPLAKINTHYYNNGYSYLKIYLEKRDYILETNNKYGNSSIFSYKGVLLNESHFESKITFFRTITSYIEENLNRIENTAKAIIETGDFNLIFKFLKNFYSYNNINIQICSDLQINESRIPSFDSYIVDYCDTSQLLKFWVYGLINYFNFNTFCYYYFTLSLEERKIFNKKARAKMGEEIKASMLKKREPWQFVEKAVLEGNFEIDIYTASWKSIWFGDGFIRVCMDSKPSFSQHFKWDFSEEKFNFLYEYISGKRLKELKFTATGDFIKSVQGLDELEELIWKILIIREVETTNGTTIRGIGSNRIPVNMLLRNQCIQLLNKFQLKELEPTRVLEKTFNPIKGGIGVDVSLLYSIPIDEYEVAIIWESLELEKAKATHIFKCLRTEYENIFSEIENYLSGTLKVRSTLNSKDADAIGQQNKLRYLCRIEHDNFDFSKWEKTLYEILPELKLFVLTNG